MKINYSNQFQALVDKYGSNKAIINIERDRHYTFTEFHLLTNRIVNLMTEKLGLGFGDRFLNILENDNLSLLHFPTIFKGPVTGAFTNYRDSLDEHLWQLDCAKPKVVFIEKQLLERYYAPIRERNIAIVCMDPLDQALAGVDYFWDLVDGASDSNPDIELDDREHCAIIRFTGGTTGKGKPAMYCLDNWLNLRDSMLSVPEHGYSACAKNLHLAPISHGSGMLFPATLSSGACTVTMNTPDLAQWCRIVEQHAITHCMMVPTMLYRLLELPEASDFDLSSVRTLFYGAAPISASKLAELTAKFGKIFIQSYGSTECFSLMALLLKQDHDADSAQSIERLTSAGQVHAGAEIIVVNEDGKPVAEGERGELWLRSRGVCMGYLDNPEKTANEFENGYWKSGDVGVKKDGYIYIVDRIKDMIISGGFNVYATEVEAAIDAYEGVFMSAVIGIPHPEWGEAIHAEVVPQEGVTIDSDQLIQFVKDKLGSYKSPKTIKVVESLPMSAVGKILRRSVRDKYWQADHRQVS